MGCGAGSLGGPPSAFHGAYILEERIGRGTYGQVWSCSHVETDERYAVKVLRLWRGPETLGKVSFMRKQLTSRDAKAKARNEAALWGRIGRHKHCVELHKVFMESMLCYLVMEPCARSVVKALQDTWPCPVEEDVLRIVYHTLLALRHIHGRGIVHRDVKPENILLGGPDGTITKLCDFGLAADLLQDVDELQEVAGTPPYMAPEMLRGEPQSEKIDLWSLGVTAYVMLYGSFPYSPAKPGSIQSVKQVISWGVPPPRYQPVADLPSPSRLAERTARALLIRSPEKREDASGVLAMAIGRELQQVAAPTEEARRSAGPRASFLAVVQAAQREMDFFQQEPRRDAGLDLVIEQRRRVSEARRNTISGEIGEGRKLSGAETPSVWRRWSTGATNIRRAAPRPLLLASRSSSSLGAGHSSLRACVARVSSDPVAARRPPQASRQSPPAREATPEVALVARGSRKGRKAKEARAEDAAAGGGDADGSVVVKSWSLPPASRVRGGGPRLATPKSPASSKVFALTTRRGSAPEMCIPALHDEGVDGIVAGPSVPRSEGEQQDGDCAEPASADAAAASSARSAYRRWSTGATDTQRAPRRSFPQGQRDLPIGSMLSSSTSFVSRASNSSLASVVPDADAFTIASDVQARESEPPDLATPAPTLLQQGCQTKAASSAGCGPAGAMRIS